MEWLFGMRALLRVLDRQAKLTLRSSMSVARVQRTARGQGATWTGSFDGNNRDLEEMPPCPLTCVIANAEALYPRAAADNQPKWLTDVQPAEYT
jgi:hypothetical protein